MNIPLVSVIIPAYNAEKYIAQALDSILDQTYSNIEIIVVNDGSTDNSLSIAKQYSSNNVKIIDQPNGGASAARNTGLRMAQGDYIQFLDADDLLSEDKIEKQVSALKSLPDDYLASCAWGRFKNSPEEAKFIKQRLWKDLDSVTFLINKYNHHQMMQPGVWLTPRSVIEKAGYWDERLSLNDDGEYFSRVVLASRGIKFVDEPKVYYRSGNPSSLASSKSRQAWESQLLSIELCADQLLQYEDSMRTREAAANLYQNFIYESYPQIPNLIDKAEKRIKVLKVYPTIEPKGTPSFEILNHLLGWKMAKKLYLMAKKLYLK